MTSWPVIIEKIPDTVWAWGPGFFALVLMIFALVVFLVVLQRLAKAYLPAFLDSQREQASAMTRLATCIESQDDRSKLSFERVILSLRVLHDDMKGARGEIEEMKRKLAGAEDVETTRKELRELIEKLAALAGKEGDE